MMNFTQDELNLMMIYSPGTKSGLMDELQKMKEQLTGREWRLHRLTEATLQKLDQISEKEFEELCLYPD